MPAFIKYEFGYSWYIAYGLAIPLSLAVALGAAAFWRGWHLWVTLLAAVIAVWSLTGLFLINIAWGINKPMELPTPDFLPSGAGRVLDAGAGSGRAAVGVLLARPKATVTALDIYEGYFGIDNNTPERFMTNARIAGVADRAEARTGDMRDMPFGEGEFDAVVSSYAIDHLGRDGLMKALSEVARVLKPGGQFLVLLVNPDWVTLVVSPPLAHHPRPDPGRWRTLLEERGFMVEEEGTQPATLFFLARKRSSSLTGG